MSEFPLILFAIAGILLLMLVVLVVLRLKGAPLAQPRTNPRIQLVIAIISSVLLAGLWWVYDFPIAILPALILPQWIVFYSQRGQPSPRKRLLLAALVGLTVLAVLLTVLFWLVNT